MANPYVAFLTNLHYNIFKSAGVITPLPYNPRGSATAHNVSPCGAKNVTTKETPSHWLAFPFFYLLNVLLQVYLSELDKAGAYVGGLSSFAQGLASDYEKRNLPTVSSQLFLIRKKKQD